MAGAAKCVREAAPEGLQDQERSLGPAAPAPHQSAFRRSKPAKYYVGFGNCTVANATEAAYHAKVTHQRG